ncbi:MAG: cysteine desulfurase [Pirellulales bacterium]|nr:cysteine desulfurase [Pirellulales bacterium]
MTGDQIYLDHNATTPLLPQVAEAMAECAAAGYGNPASQHAAGRHARQTIEAARETIGRILGVDVDTHRGDRILFTSGATEANNLALRGLNPNVTGAIYVSAIEHPSVAGVAEQLRRRGEQVVTLPVTRDGILDLAAAAELIQPGGRLVAVMLGNNDTGILQPIAELSALCRARNVPLFTDAVQGVGKIDVDFRALGVAALSASAHKFHGPPGVGVLVVRPEVSLEPLLFGGFQQGGLRPGTESVALAVGMRCALEGWQQERSARQQRLSELRQRLEAGLRQIWPQAVIHGEQVARLPHTTCVSLVGLDRQALLLALDLAGVAVSTGSACASGSSEPAPALVAAGCAEPLLESALRLSLGGTTTAAEVEQALEKIAQVCRHLQGAKRARNSAGAARRTTHHSL